jgi:hypothetical protein
MAAAMRQIVREEAVREGLQMVSDKEQVPSDAMKDAAASQKPFWERALDIASTIPAEEQERFPADGSEQLDHYVYGVEKRPPELR